MGIMRKTCYGLIALAVFWVAAASALDNPTAAYIATRDKAVSHFNDPAETGPDVNRRMDDALSQLYGMLQPLIEPVRLEGFASSGAYNVDDLFKELGYGKLDAIVVQSLDGRGKAIVTTVPLFTEWLKSTPDLLQRPLTSSAKDVADAFAADDFATYAWADDVHYYKYAELPVATPLANGRAYAFLYYAGQDETAPSPPDHMVVAVMNGGHVVIFDVPLAAPYIEACEAAFRLMLKRAQASRDEYRASHFTDGAKREQVEATEDKAASDFYRCYAKSLPDATVYPGLVREAQRLVDKVR